MGVENSSILAILKPLTPKMDPIPHPPKIKKSQLFYLRDWSHLPPTLHETGLIKFAPQEQDIPKEKFVESFVEFEELFW